jgi:hypothetical protein
VTSLPDKAGTREYVIFIDDTGWPRVLREAADFIEKQGLFTVDLVLNHDPCTNDHTVTVYYYRFG